MSEKMREDYEAYVLTERGRAYLQRNEDGEYQDLFVQEGWESWQAAITHATGGQESESQAVAKIIDDGTKEGGVEWLPINCGPLKIGGLLYLAPPSAPAIEVAALRNAAEVCDAVYPEASHLHLVAKGFGEKIRATIPQDGITALENLCMRVAEETAFYGFDCGSSGRDMKQEELRTIVTNELRRMAEGEK